MFNGGIECRILPTPAVSDSNLCVEKNPLRLDRGYAHCTVTLQDKSSGAFRAVKEEPKSDSVLEKYLLALLPDSNRVSLSELLREMLFSYFTKPFST